MPDDEDVCPGDRLRTGPISDGYVGVPDAARVHSSREGYRRRPVAIRLRMVEAS